MRRHGAPTIAPQSSKPEHRMHLAELAQEKREHHDPGNDRQLRRLKIDRPKVEPAARSVDFCPDESVRIRKTSPARYIGRAPQRIQR